MNWARWGAGAAISLLLIGCASALPSPVRRASWSPVIAPATPVAVTPVALPTPARLPQATRIALEGQAIQGGLMLGNVPTGTTRLTLNATPVRFANDGRFVLAFDRDAGATATLVAERRDGSGVTQAIAVAPRAWRIERLNSLPRISQPSAEFQRRRAPELAQINAARAKDTGAQGWRQQFLWPVTGRLSGLFGAQRVYRGEPGSYHSGVDVARPTGTPLMAPADGVVVLATPGEFTLEGRLLMIDHGMGLNSAFLHMDRIDVREGNTVRRGQRLGTVGATGRATGPHMHWGMKWGDARIDPLLLAGPMPAAE